VVARVFRPTLLDVLQITNLELGVAFSVYGIVAMLAYFPGGLLADRFSARALMATSLLATAGGGLVFATLPDLQPLIALYGFWGASTILLFWGAMIRATRRLGGANQGRTFGVLDGGRGLFAALLGTAAVSVFAWLLPVEAADASLADRQQAFVQILWLFTGMTACAAALVWVLVPPDPMSSPGSSPWTPREAASSVLSRPTVWLQAGIVVAAYTCYRGLDDVGLLARDVYGYDDVQAAQVATVAMWVRPVAAIGAGLLGDRIGSSRAILGCFLLLIGANGAIAAGVLQPTRGWLLLCTVACVALGASGLRGLYFAVFREAGVPAARTGAAVGLVSFIGFTPDVFMGPINGWFTDTWPGPVGHQLFFGFLAGAAALGLACALAFHRRARS